MKEKKRAKKTAGKASAQVKVVEKKVSSEAMRGVGAIFFLAFAGFLVIAELGGGGTVGQTLFSWLSYLLGVGYWLLPLSFALLSVQVFRSHEERFGWVQVLGLLVFLLSALGLVSLAFPSKGGLIGSSVSDPLISAIATPATIVFLAAFMIAALIIAFDANLPELFTKTRDRFRSEPESEEYEIDDVPVTGIHQEESDDTYEESEEEYAAPAPMPERKPAVSSFADKTESDASESGFPIIAATGSEYEPPPVSLLSKNKGKPEVGDVKGNMNIIKRTLQNFGIQVEMDEASIGPTVTRYSMKPAEGVRLSKIVALQSNLELALAAAPIRIEAPIPGKSLVGMEVPNIARTTLGLAPILTDEQYTGSDKPLFMALGRTITGQAQYADMAKMPHLLVAGATGSGKSVTIHNFIVSLLYRCGPERLRFIMVDPKRVELTLYNSIPHLLTPVITDPKKAILALKWLAKEMDRRYGILETHKVRDISSYHANVVAPALEKGVREGDTPPEAMPYIVVVIDELADIMQTYPRELEAGIVRLAQMSRAVGIHLILSTQRPSVKVITGLIKANIPARVALQVASGIDSRTILDATGAEKLLGAGDMLFLSGEMSKPRRIQAPYLSEAEVKKVVGFIAKNAEGTLPSEIDFTESGKIGGGLETVFDSMADEEEEDELYSEAKKTVIEAGKASTSYLQRKLGVGYARAAKLIDMLEERGVVGPADGAKPRDVIGAGNADDLVRAAERAEEGGL